MYKHFQGYIEYWFRIVRNHINQIAFAFHPMQSLAFSIMIQLHLTPSYLLTHQIHPHTLQRRDRPHRILLLVPIIQFLKEISNKPWIPIL